MRRWSIVARRTRLWRGAFAAALAVAGCGKGEQQQGTEGATVVARVGKRDITAAELEQAIQALPRHQQAEFQGAMGRKRFLDQLVNQQLIVLAAEERGLDKSPTLAARLRDVRESLLQQAYQDYLLEGLPKPTEEDLRRYYETHSDEFIVKPRVNASWIKCATRAQAEAARRRIVDKGEHFGTVAREVTIDKCSQKDNGLLGYFNPTGYIRCVGKPAEFAALAFELEADDVGPVFEWDGGWAFIKVHEKTTERQEPYSTARERIAARLRPQLTDSMLTAEVQHLRQRFGVETFLNLEQELAGKSAEELMRLATEAASPLDKITYYQALIAKYPHHERADEAQFMIAFVHSEELKDYEAARVEYQKVIDNYPRSEVRDSALYMIQNLGREDLPAFEGLPSPDGGAPGSPEKATAVQN